MGRVVLVRLGVGVRVRVRVRRHGRCAVACGEGVPPVARVRERRVAARETGALAAVLVVRGRGRVVEAVGVVMGGRREEKAGVRVLQSRAGRRGAWSERTGERQAIRWLRANESAEECVCVGEVYSGALGRRRERAEQTDPER